VDRITLHYTEPLLRSAVKAFWVRVVGWKFFVAVTVMIAALSRLIVHGNRTWFIGALAAALVLALVGAGAVYFTQLRSTLGRFRAMRTKEAALEFDDARIRLIADTGSLEIPWTGVRDVWRFPEFWLVFVSPAQFLTLPTADVNEPARELIAAKVREYGGKIS
jgi:hypothetical protein